LQIVTPEQFLADLGRHLRARRTTRGLSQQQLAARAGMSTRYVSQIEAGRGNVSILRLLELTRALGIPLHQAVRFDGWHSLVALVGLRGAGKSTVGRIVSERLERPFVELDALVKEKAGLSLEEIFALHGERYYRRLEREALEELSSAALPAVLATGGSLVTDRDTYELLKSTASTVWLRASPELHLQRVAAQGDPRPMAGRADPLAELRALLREREALYQEADIVIDTSELSPDSVARELVRRLREGGAAAEIS
jgi:XRE family transcriptional regulator, aerobic/anaerobic benzoate catabolism transcriptional regulator